MQKTRLRNSISIAAILLAGVSCSRAGQQDKAAAGSAVEPAILSAAGLDPKAGEASPQGRLLIGRGRDYVPIAQDPQTLFDTLQGSMEERRKTAWRIVEAMLEPQKLTLGGKQVDVPLWHTWFEGMSANPEMNERINLFIAAFAECRSDPDCKKSRAEIARDVVAMKATKNFVRGLTSANFGQTLHQFEGAANLPGDDLGQGFTLFSPSFLEHVLTEAEGIEKCAPTVPWNQPPPSQSQFSPCITEFPRSAVMVKASWEPLEAAESSSEIHNTGAAAMRQIISSGNWLAPASAVAHSRNMYVAQTTDNTLWGLKSIHFSTKDTREWIWISLWWDPNVSADYGQDRPASIALFNGGVWRNYKMCVTSSFKEGDPQPWRSYEQGQPGLAAAIRATYDAMAAQRGPQPHHEVTTWCSNPNIERQAGNARTNCIGCHQYSQTWNQPRNRRMGFSDTFARDQQGEYPQYGRSRRRANFPADFSWSFWGDDGRRGFGPVIRDARRAQGFEW